MTHLLRTIDKACVHKYTAPYRLSTSGAPCGQFAVFWVLGGKVSIDELVKSLLGGVFDNFLNKGVLPLTALKNLTVRGFTRVSSFSGKRQNSLENVVFSPERRLFTSSSTC